MFGTNRAVEQLDSGGTLVFAVGMAADRAVIAVKARAFASRHKGLGGNATTVQVLGHAGEQTVQVVPDAGQFFRRGQMFAGSRTHLPTLGVEGQRHELSGAPGVHGTADALVIHQRTVQRVGGRDISLFPAGFGAGPGGGGRVGQQVFHPRRRRPREEGAAVAFQGEQI